MIQMIHFASLFLFTDPAPTWTYTLSLHDALPIFSVDAVPPAMAVGTAVLIVAIYVAGSRSALRRGAADRSAETDLLLPGRGRSEERRVGKECRSRWSRCH